MQFYINQLSQMLADLKIKQVSAKRELARYPKDGKLSLYYQNKYLVKRLIFNSNGESSRKAIGRKSVAVHKYARRDFLRKYLDGLDLSVDELKALIADIQKSEEDYVLKRLPPIFLDLPRNYLLEPAPVQERRVPASMNTAGMNRWSMADNRTGQDLRTADDSKAGAVETISAGPFPTGDPSLSIKAAVLNIPGILPCEWGKLPYRMNTSFPEKKTSHHPCGIYLRSKSEASILSVYFSLGIVPHYDELILFNGVLKSPDFIGIRGDGKVIYHEHFGRTNDPEYMKQQQEKLKLYAKFGIMPWDNLIITYDNPDGSLDLRLVEAEIRAKYHVW